MITRILFAFSLITLLCLNAVAQTDNTPTATTPTAQETPTGAATPAPDAACVPSCRTGYVCHQGECVSACNPPCGAGYECSAQVTCIPVASPVAAAPAPQPVTISAAAPSRRDERLAARAAVIEERHQYRATQREFIQKTRLVLNTDWQWVLGDSFDDGNAFRSSFLLSVGVHKNLTSFFGIRTVAGGSIGYAADDLFSDSDQTLCWSVGVNVTPFFGPLGSFFIGPTFWFRNYWTKDAVYVYDYDLDAAVKQDKNQAMGGIGVNMGILLGKKMQYGLNWRFKTSLLNNFDLIAELGFTYHFLLQ